MSSSIFAKLAAAAFALAAVGTATVAQARDNVYFSIGANVAPGVVVGVSNAPAYYPPVYTQPAPIYMQPAPIYVQPAPVYMRPAPVFVRPAPVYYAPAPVYYDRGHRPGHRKEWRNDNRRHGQGYGYGYGRR